MDLDRLEKGADKNLTVFNEEKLRVLYLGRNGLMYTYLLGATSLESVSAEKALRILVATKLKVSQQCARRLIVFLAALGRALPTG